MNTIKRITSLFLIIIVMIACSDVLDKENLSEITTDDVWTNNNLSEACLNDIYYSFMPQFPTGWKDPLDMSTDEAIGTYGRPGFSDYLKGSISSGSIDYFPYNEIRKINVFLSGIENATFNEDIKDNQKGEALFWRAWAYFEMVKRYGGVPLVLKPESPTADDDLLFLPRNKTSECFTQIIKDLDDAINLLFEKDDLGRIDKCAAMAFKGRVLLFKASPQFNRNSDSGPWQDAYDANKAALSFLRSKGKGLHPDYRGIWLDKMNEEVIMVRGISYPETGNDKSQPRMRPLLYASGGTGLFIPTLELVNSFPMKDGSKWNTETMEYKDLHKNRGDRFYATIAYNGANPYILDMIEKPENLWTFYYDGDNNPSTGINGKEKCRTNVDNFLSYSSFYCAKMHDQTITKATDKQGSVDFIELRFAEVLLNFAEAANEIGKAGEAKDALGEIRERAGIESGGNYGITATSIEELRKVIQDERFIELCFESKRFWDLRRWRIYTKVFDEMPGNTKHGLRIEYDGPLSELPKGLVGDFDEISGVFTYIVQEDNAGATNMLSEDQYSFFGIPSSVLERNSNFEQNNTWDNGTFDPLK